MWTPTVLDFKNLVTHKNSTLQFLQNKSILLIGKNSTQNNGANSNGSGKSTVVNAFCLAITGDPEREGMSKENYITYGETSCSVSILLVNKILNRRMIIDRVIHLKKSQELKITVDGVEKFNTAIDKNNDQAQKFIYDEIGINREDLLNYFIISQGNDSSFFNSSDTKQKEVIARFSNFNIIDQLSSKYDAEYNSFEKRKIEVEQNIALLKASIIQYKEDIAELNEAFKDSKEQELINKKQILSRHIKDEEENKKSSIDIESKIESLLKTIKDKKSKLIDVEKYEKNIKILRENKRTKEDEVTEIEILEGQLNTYKGGVLKCPGCELLFNPNNSDLTPKEVDKNLKDLIQMKRELNEEIDSINNKISINRDKINQNKSINDSIESLNGDVEFSKNIKTRLFREKTTLLENKLKIKREIDELNKKDKEDTSKIEKKIENCEDQIEANQELLKEISLRQEESSFFKFHFSNKGFRTYLANKSIKSIQDIVNFYLNKFKIDCQVNISGYSVLKNGDIRDKISVSVLSDNKSQPFKSFSGGERVRIIVCSIVALNTLINNTCEYGKGLDCLMIDELPYIDKIGAEKMVETMAQTKITSLIVLHNVEDLSYEHKRYVCKVNGVSKLKLFL